MVAAPLARRLRLSSLQITLSSAGSTSIRLTSSGSGASVRLRHARPTMRSATSAPTISPPLPMTSSACAPSIGNSLKRLRISDGMRQRRPSTSARKSSRKLSSTLQPRRSKSICSPSAGSASNCACNDSEGRSSIRSASSSIKSSAAPRVLSSIWPRVNISSNWSNTSTGKSGRRRGLQKPAPPR